MRTTLFTITGIILLAFAVGIGFLWGNKHALDRLTIVQVTPDQVVQAMGNDDFFGLWRESTLVIPGTVAGITKQSGDTLIQLKANSVSKAYCDIGSATTSLIVGSPVRVIAEGEIANRIPEGVMLAGCWVL